MSPALNPPPASQSRQSDGFAHMHMQGHGRHVDEPAKVVQKHTQQPKRLLTPLQGFYNRNLPSMSDRPLARAVQRLPTKCRHLISWEKRNTAHSTKDSCETFPQRWNFREHSPAAKKRCSNRHSTSFQRNQRTLQQIPYQFTYPSTEHMTITADVKQMMTE